MQSGRHAVFAACCWAAAHAALPPQYVPVLGATAAARMDQLLEEGGVPPPPSPGMEVWISPLGTDGASGAQGDPLRTLDAARALVASKQPLPAGGAAVYLEEGTYFPAVAGGPNDYSVPHLSLSSADSGTQQGPITYTAAPGADPANVVLSGGYPINPKLFTPYSGADGAFMANLTEAGVDPSFYGDFKAGALGQCATPALMQLYVGGQPMVRARFPNLNVTAGPAGLPDAWLHISTAPNATSEFTYSPAEVPAAQVEAWGVGEPGSNVWAHGFWKFGWADSFVHLESVNTTSNLITVDPQTKPVYQFEPKARWYVLNALSELDVPYEYFIDTTNHLLYVFPPPGINITNPDTEVVLSAASTSIVADASTHTEVRASKLVQDGVHDGPPGRSGLPHWDRGAQGAPTVRYMGSPRSETPSSYVSWIRLVNLTIAYTQSTGVQVDNGANWTIAHVDSSNHGANSIIVDGYDTTMAFNTARGMGCQACSLQGGDTKSLTPGNNVAAGNTISHYALETRTYNPGLRFGGVGNAYGGNSISAAPHEGMTGGGNDHLFYANNFTDLTWAVTDSGAWYAGRSWVYRGSILAANTFTNITFLEKTVLGSPSVHAIYFDDELSNHTTIDNTIDNAYSAVIVGGGRRHIITGNTFTGQHGLGPHAVELDDRGETWQKSYCEVNGTFEQELIAVNYTQPPWSTRYPWIVNIMQEYPCVPVYNTISNNQYSSGYYDGFLSADKTDYQKWMDTVVNNVEM